MIMKQQLLLIMMMLLPIVSNAYTGEVEIDGIRYNISTREQTADAIGLANVNYSGAITIPSSLEYEGKICYVKSVGGFASSPGITSVKICEGMIEIKYNAFKDCRQLTAIDIAQSVVYVGRDSFTGTAWYDNEADGLVYLNHIVYKYKGEMSTETEIIVKEGTKVIASRAFEKKENLKSITFPSSLLAINSRAFLSCTSLQSLVLNNLLVGPYAFAECSGLNDVTINNVEFYELTNGVVNNSPYYSSCFSNCKKIEKVKINCSIVPDCFGGKSIKDIVLGDDVKEIYDGAFDDASIENIEIPDGVIYLSGFSGCTELKSLSIPENVSVIGDNAFKNCTGLTSLSIPGNVREIGKQAFMNCSNLSTITLSSGLRKLDYSSFDGCSSLTSLIIPNTVDSIGAIPPFMNDRIGYTFASCTNLTSIVLPDNMHYLAQRTFWNCSKLKSIVIPEGISTIEDGLFYNCSSMESVTLPSTVNLIKGSPFYGCNELTDIYCYSPKPPKFSGSNPLREAGAQYITLHVPANAIEDYKTTEHWNEFKEIVVIDDYGAKKCATPVISYVNGQLKFNCDTENAHFISNITDEDIKSSEGSVISLTATYHISVYAIASGHVNSDVAIATLCWIDATPEMEGVEDMTDGVGNVRAKAVLIQKNGDILTISGVNEGMSVRIYDTAGRMVGSTQATGETCSVRTKLGNGQVGIVKIGEKEVKFLSK